MTEQPLDVHYAGLTRATRYSREAANILTGKVNEHLAGCAAAGDSHKGWETTAALNECVEAWASHLRGIVDDAHDIGQRIHRTHAGYADAEWDSDRRSRAMAVPPAVREV
ncbi:hypothetical protein OG417_13245 [Actinoallomurus sp. NBC_01490]|jgi:hypothetical protein|uniref:hypothetical protein n=1 Tax=Actinoallomurus sp. NBC_01490 TaxID=2903557 RepID=UPI002E32F0C6|nr:hypothetical protein [Actinoallomurus sp. NBC_01490]